MDDCANGLSVPGRQALSQLLELASGQEDVLPAEELRLLLQRQLETPLDIDLGDLDPGLADEIRQWCGTDQLRSRDLLDVIQDTHPPLGLLNLVKDFSKAHVGHPTSLWPTEISCLLYFIAIAVARTRCGTCISKLNAEELGRGFEWASRQAWAGPVIQQLALEALGCTGRRPEARLKSQAMI